MSRARTLLLWTLATAAVAAFVWTLGRLAIAPAAVEAGPLEAGTFGLPDLLFYLLSAVTLGGAAAVALSRNILRSAVGLLAALLGVGGIYVFLSADFVAITQVLVYIGGVLVLVLFAVMLTSKITDVNVSNTSVGLFGGVLLFVAVAPVLGAVAILTPWATRTPGPLAPTTRAIGDAFLTKWLLPFEVASILLLATLVGAVVMARKEIRPE
jgi:NAD(P)H-quinone oxidoreductase subunit 6